MFFQNAGPVMPVSTIATATYKIVQITRVAMIPMGMSRFGFLASSAAVDTESNPMYVKKMMEPPVSTPPQPFGMKGCQFSGFTSDAPAITKAKMAPIFRITIALFAFADSLMPRTSRTVNSITITNAGQLNPKCQPLPGVYAGLDHRSLM